MSEQSKLAQEQQKRRPQQGGGPAGALARPVEKAKDFKGTIKRLMRYLAPQKATFIVVGVLAVASTTFSIVGPKIMGWATTKIGDGLLARMQWLLTLKDVQEHNYPPGYVAKIVNQQPPAFDFEYIGHILVLLAVLYAISALCSYVMGYLMSTVAQKTVFTMRNDLKEKLNRLPLKYFDTHSSGDILSRVTNDMDNIAQTLQQSLTQLITSIISIVGVLLMMISISPLMTLIALVMLPISGVLTMQIAKRSQRFFGRQQRYIGNLSGHVEEMFTGHKIVKLFGKEKASVEEFKRINDELYDAGWKAQFMSGLIMPVMGFVNNLAYVAVCVLGGFMVAKRMLDIGDVQAFIQYVRSFTQPIVQTANIANIIQSTVASAERVFEIMDEQEEIPDAEDAKPLSDPKGDVRFEHVHFGYSEDNILMEDVNIEVKAGQTIAVVGPTGAGKTTLVNLLMRFYELSGGQITFDGRNIAELARNELRSEFGMVLQDTWLFKGTIAENIAYSKLSATPEEIHAAAEAAKADRFIRTLPDGYDTILNEEASNISQGQKQLLTIARVILADPAVLILDEATSNVDTRTEQRIQKAMNNMMRGRTSFVIAHRLSTIKNADMILVMNHGTIIEKGTHEDLLTRGGFYAELYNSQFAH